MSCQCITSLLHRNSFHCLDQSANHKNKQCEKNMIDALSSSKTVHLRYIVMSRIFQSYVNEIELRNLIGLTSRNFSSIINFALLEETKSLYKSANRVKMRKNYVICQNGRNLMKLNLFFRHVFKRVTAYIKTAGDATRKDEQTITAWKQHSNG